MHNTFIMPSPFASKLAAVAQEQHTKFQFITEGDPRLCKQIKKWTTDIGAAFVSCSTEPWSAVFISWCVLDAGASKTEFKFSKAHSQFVHQAIRNALDQKGVFHGMKITEHAPQVGDIIHMNRRGNKFDFNFARDNARYESHSVIVVETGEDTNGKFAFCIGGNEGDAIRRSIVPLNNNGFIKQRPNNPFISVIKNLK